MKTFNRWLIIPIFTFLTVFMSSCEVIGGIFKAGVWSGVLLVVGGIVLVIFLIAKIFGGGKK